MNSSIICLRNLTPLNVAGKYLNVVRECGRDVTCPDAKEVLYTLKERAYVEQIEKAYNYASKVLLDFLMEEKELVSRLRFVIIFTCVFSSPVDEPRKK